MEMIYVDIFVATIRYRSFFCLFTSCRRTEDDTYTIYRNRLLCIKCEYFRPHHVIQYESKYHEWTNIHEIEGKKQQQLKKMYLMLPLSGIKVRILNCVCSQLMCGFSYHDRP